MLMAKSERMETVQSATSVDVKMLQKMPPNGHSKCSVLTALNGSTHNPTHRSVEASDRMNRLVGVCIRRSVSTVTHTSRLPKIVTRMMIPNTTPITMIDDNDRSGGS
ncbi:hypothetical protein LSAT2_014024, partial [Lamellibrachia satsuma]